MDILFEKRWGIYPQLFTYLGSGTEICEIVPAEEIEKVRSNHAPWLIYYLEGQEDGYLHLRYRDFRFKVRPDGFQAVESPSCTFDDIILIQRSSGKIERATVIGPAWHAKRGQHYYRVRVVEKIISRWIFEKDILSKVGVGD